MYIPLHPTSCVNTNHRPHILLLKIFQKVFGALHVADSFKCLSLHHASVRGYNRQVLTLLFENFPGSIVLQDWSEYTTLYFELGSSHTTGNQYVNNKKWSDHSSTNLCRTDVTAIAVCYGLVKSGGGTNDSLFTNNNNQSNITTKKTQRFRIPQLQEK